MRKIRTNLLVGLASVALFPGAVLAQQTASEVAEAPTTSGIADIVVTAQRREERLQNVPISVTALNASQLSNSGITSTLDLTTVTPTLTISQTAGRPQPRLRGVGTSFGAAGLENSVATYVDGVYLAAAPGSVFSLAGIERIEVLKGPQGTLFGRNATGGLIQIVTKKPSEQFGGTLSGSYDNYDTITGDGYITSGLAPGLAVDFAAHASFQGDGYGRNRFLNIDSNRTDEDIAFRSQLLYSGDTTNFRLAVDYSKLEGSPYESVRTTYDIPVFGPSLPDASPWDSNGNVAWNMLNKNYGFSLAVNQELSFADLVSITALRRGRFSISVEGDNTPTDAFSVDFVEKDKQFSQELQLLSKPESPVSWLVGAYYFRASSRYSPVDINFGPPLQDPAFPIAVLRTFNRQATRSYAGFAQSTVPIGEATRLTGGLRYTIERKEFDAVQSGILASGVEAPLGVRLPDHKNFRKLTWRLSLDHRFSPAVMVYASYNRGFKSGGYNTNADINNVPFNPEQLDAYEIGIKADIFDRRVRLNPSFFYYDYKDVQVTTFTAQSLPVFVNGPSAKLYGLDVDLVVQPVERLTFRGALVIMHHRFGDFPGAPFVIPNPAPTPGSVQVIGNAKGNRLPYTADWSGTIAADYVVPTSFGKATLSATYNHSDGFFTEVDNIRRQKPYDLVNASLRVENDTGSIFASLWAQNLFSEVVAVQIIGGVATGGAAAYQPPRTYGLTVGTKF